MKFGGRNILKDYLARRRELPSSREEPPPAGIGEALAVLDRDALARLKRGDVAGAVGCYEELVVLAGSFGHERGYRWACRLAELYTAQGRAAEAGRLLEEWLERDPPERWRRSLLNALAEAELGMGLVEAALLHYEELLELASGAPQPAAARAEALNGVGLVYLRRREPHRARGPLSEAAELRRAVLGEDDAQTAITLHNLGEASISSDPAGAERCYRDAAAILRRTDPPGSRRLTLAYLSLGHFLVGRGRGQEALEALDLGLASARLLPEGMAADLREALVRDLEAARGLPEPATKQDPQRSQPPADLEWWRRGERSPDSVRIQLLASPEMTGALYASIAASLGAAGKEAEGPVASIEVLHRIGSRPDHLGIELASQRWIRALLGGMLEVLRERQEPVAVWGDDIPTRSLLRLPGFGPPTPEGGVPPLPPPPPHRPVDRDPEIALTGEEMQVLLASRMYAPAVVELAEAFLRGEDLAGTESCVPLFLHGQDPHVHALYCALVRRWSRSFQIPGHLLALARQLMADRWTREVERFLADLRADFDVRPSGEVRSEGVIVCRIQERRAVMRLAEGPLMALGNLVSGISAQWSELLVAAPVLAESTFASISFADPARVKLLSMVLRALGYADQTVRPDLSVEKPHLCLNSFGHLYWTVSGVPPFPIDVVEASRRAEAQFAERMRSLCAPR